MYVNFLDLQIWNGENYELSFKLWLCGGQLLEVPCSRVGHIWRHKIAYRAEATFDFVAHNFKRIAEVLLRLLISKHCDNINDIYSPGLAGRLQERSV